MSLVVKMVKSTGNDSEMILICCVMVMFLFHKQRMLFSYIDSCILSEHYSFQHLLEGTGSHILYRSLFSWFGKFSRVNSKKVRVENPPKYFIVNIKSRNLSSINSFKCSLVFPGNSCQKYKFLVDSRLKCSLQEQCLTTR